MSVEEIKSDVSSQSLVSSPTSPTTTNTTSWNRGKQMNAASTQICGFQVLEALRPKHFFKPGELSVKGSSLLSRQLRSPASSEASEESSETPRGPVLPRIRTPRRRFEESNPFKFSEEEKEREVAKDKAKEEEKSKALEPSPMGTIFVTSL